MVRSSLNLLGNHIDTSSGKWIAVESSVGGATDSFYEYLLKASILFNDGEYQALFKQAYTAALAHLKRGPWYVGVSMCFALYLLMFYRYELGTTNFSCI